MTLTFSPFIIPPLVAALVAAFLAYYAWQRRPLAGSVSFLVLMIAVAQLSLAYALMLSAADASDKLLWAKVQYFGAVTVSVACTTVNPSGEKDATAITTRTLDGESHTARGLRCPFRFPPVVD